MKPPLDINEILSLPASHLASLSDAQLTDLLSPFFPASRQPVLPEMKPGQRTTVTAQAIKTTLSYNQGLIKQLKALQANT